MRGRLRFDKRFDRFIQNREHLFHACVIEQGFVVPDQKMVKLQLDLRYVYAYPVYVSSNFIDLVNKYWGYWVMKCLFENKTTEGLLAKKMNKNDILEEPRNL